MEVLKIGTYVYVTGRSKYFGVSEASNLAAKEHIPVRISNTGMYRIGNKNDIRYYTVDVRDANPTRLSDIAFNIEEDFVEVITDSKELSAALEQARKKFALAQEKLDKAVLKIIKPKIGYLKRSFSQSNDQGSTYQTNRNQIRLGVWNKDKNTFSATSNFPLAVCCSLTKTTSDLEVYIPKMYLDLFGYSKTDLKNWLKFLQGCEIGFDAELSETVPNLDGRLSCYPQVRKAEPDRKFFIFKESGVNVIIPFKEHYVVRIKGSKNSMISYLRFICLRYLYNDRYWTIPGTAMQIKKALGNNITNWQALLMAHTRMNYYNYYCLVANGTSTHADILQKPEDVLNKVERGMNAAFAQKTRTVNTREHELNALFEKKDYKTIFERLTTKN